VIAKYRRRFPGFDEKIVSLYVRGMTVRDIQAHLRELHGIEVSPDLVNMVTDAMLEQVWRLPRCRPERPFGATADDSEPCNNAVSWRIRAE
jgi:putative transposase